MSLMFGAPPSLQAERINVLDSVLALQKRTLKRLDELSHDPASAIAAIAQYRRDRAAILQDVLPGEEKRLIKTGKKLLGKVDVDMEAPMTADLQASERALGPLLRKNSRFDTLIEEEGNANLKLAGLVAQEKLIEIGLIASAKAFFEVKRAGA